MLTPPKRMLEGKEEKDQSPMVLAKKYDLIFILNKGKKMVHKSR
jgi:hypothetical protein